MKGPLMKKVIFKDFQEYWFYAKGFSKNQRDIILSNLNKSQIEQLKASYYEGGWDDLEIRNEIDKKIDTIQKNYGINLINVHCEVLKGKSFLMKKDHWESISDMFKKCDPKHVRHILGKVKVEKLDDNMVLLVKEKNEQEK